MDIIFRKTGRLVQGEPGNGSQKFWNAEVKGNSVTIHFGKVGTTGTVGCREFKDYEAAEIFLAQRVRKKLEEGYKPEL
ncbi:MAG: WGR domain-containing protein [Candidatus Thorarchaeota archaeon]|nr:MAG: WGR domain-containing protein [Candidatus Thorarchaeota archaeon]